MTDKQLIYIIITIVILIIILFIIVKCIITKIKRNTINKGGFAKLFNVYDTSDANNKPCVYTYKDKYKLPMQLVGLYCDPPLPIGKDLLYDFTIRMGTNDLFMNKDYDYIYTCIFAYTNLIGILHDPLASISEYYNEFINYTNNNGNNESCFNESYKHKNGATIFNFYNFNDFNEIAKNPTARFEFKTVLQKIFKPEAAEVMCKAIMDIGELQTVDLRITTTSFIGQLNKCLNKIENKTSAVTKQINEDIRQYFTNRSLNIDECPNSVYENAIQTDDNSTTICINPKKRSKSVHAAKTLLLVNAGIQQLMQPHFNQPQLMQPQLMQPQLMQPQFNQQLMQQLMQQQFNQQPIHNLAQHNIYQHIPSDQQQQLQEQQNTFQQLSQCQEQQEQQLRALQEQQEQQLRQYSRQSTTNNINNLFKSGGSLVYSKNQKLPKEQDLFKNQDLPEEQDLFKNQELIDRSYNGKILINGCKALARLWYQASELEIRKIFFYYELGDEYNITINKVDPKNQSNAGTEKANGIADIYPAEKATLFLIYLCMYCGAVSDNEIVDRIIDNINFYINVYVIYVHLFNSFCTCVMESKWNSSISNEFVYLKYDLNGQQTINVMDFDNYAFAIRKLCKSNRDKQFDIKKFVDIARKIGHTNNVRTIANEIVDHTVEQSLQISKQLRNMYDELCKQANLKQIYDENYKLHFDDMNIVIYNCCRQVYRIVYDNLNLMLGETTIELKDYINTFKTVFNYIITYLQSDDDIEVNYQIVENYLTAKFTVANNKYTFKMFLYMLNDISLNYYRDNNFVSKIERLLLIHADQLVKLSKFEILNIFILNKLILRFLFDKKILNYNECLSVLSIVNTKFSYIEYFKDFPNNKEENVQQLNIHKEKAQKGENDNYLCELIRKDAINEFVQHVSNKNVDLNIPIKASIYETNLYLIENQNTTLIEYAAFFGSVNIFKYLILNKATINPSLYLYAIHGNNEAILTICENDLKLKPTDQEKKRQMILREHVIRFCYTDYNRFEKLLSEEYKNSTTCLAIKYYKFNMITPENIDLSDKQILSQLCYSNYVEIINYVLTTSKKLDYQMLFDCSFGTYSDELVYLAYQPLNIEFETDIITSDNGRLFAHNNMAYKVVHNDDLSYKLIPQRIQTLDWHKMYKINDVLYRVVATMETTEYLLQSIPDKPQSNDKSKSNNTPKEFIIADDVVYRISNDLCNYNQTTYILKMIPCAKYLFYKIADDYYTLLNNGKLIKIAIK